MKFNPLLSLGFKFQQLSKTEGPYIYS